MAVGISMASCLERQDGEYTYSQDITQRLGNYPISLEIEEIYCVPVNRFRTTRFTGEEALVVIRDKAVIRDIHLALRESLSRTERKAIMPLSRMRSYWVLLFVDAEKRYGEIILMIGRDRRGELVFALEYLNTGGSWGYYRFSEASAHLEKYLLEEPKINVWVEAETDRR